MPNIDTRKLTKEARATLRQVAIKMYQSGETQVGVADTMGLRRPTVAQWIRDYQRSGEASFDEGQRGRPSGSGRLLTAAQETRIQEAIIDKTPDQLKLSFVLWNAKAVSGLVDQYFGLKVQGRTIRKYLKRWGFTPQRPLRRAYEQNPKATKKWLDETYPQLQARAQQEHAQIYWGDEAGVSSHEHHPREYAPKGKTPVLVLSQSKRERINFVSAITNQGTVKFMLYQQNFTAQTMIQFLQRLIKEADHKVFLVLDNLRVHHSQVVRQWVEQRSDDIELFFLPSYSPELNPDEYLNCDLKAKLNADTPPRKPGDLKRKVLSHMRSIQRQPQRVTSYFKNEHIRYAA